MNNILLCTVDKKKDLSFIYHNRVGLRCVLHQDTETCQVITMANSLGRVGEVYITTFFRPQAPISEKGFTKTIARMVSCLLKHLTRNIWSNEVRRFDVSNIIINNKNR